MVRRGWIRLGKVPPRRIGYYLTPQGLTEKTRLAITFLSYNVHHYSQLKKIIADKFLEMTSQGVKQVIFWGVSDEMEIAYVTLQGTTMELVAIVDDNDKVNGKIVLGEKVQNSSVINNSRADAILITSIFYNDESVTIHRLCN